MKIIIIITTTTTIIMILLLLLLIIIIMDTFCIALLFIRNELIALGRVQSFEAFCAT